RQCRRSQISVQDAERKFREQSNRWHDMAYMYGILSVIGWGFTLLCATFTAGFFMGLSSALKDKTRGFDVAFPDQSQHEKQL
ncbi:MAG TPA: hypothetical protein VKK61_06730, partial [Tepidisphaeraceae bacterium]|nr:hypothetical protein [Tepidisphaeraceae bacterium]